MNIDIDLVEKLGALATGLVGSIVAYKKGKGKRKTDHAKNVMDMYEETVEDITKFKDEQIEDLKKEIERLKNEK
mgnify:FL=1